MSKLVEHPEYNRDTNPYLSFGKKYNGEKAIISLTSWSKRIATCPKTLFSLIKQCPGFHIVLVLAEEEFPKMTAELPDNLMLFVENKLIELMFVRKNYRSFKKFLFTMDKYRNVPIISADDDCIYTCNYAQELYDKWLNNKNNIILYHNSHIEHLQGPITLYPPACFPINNALINKIKSFMKNNNSEDTFFTDLAKRLRIYFKFTNNYSLPYYFHDEIEPIHPEYKYHFNFRNCYLK